MDHFRRFLLMALWPLLISGVHAEGGSCPTGYYPIGGQGTMGCAPLPGTGNQQPPQPPAQQWERRWGAISTDAPAGVIGVATDKESKQEASQFALGDCHRQGGVNCRIDVAYDNQCAVLVVGANGYNTPNAATTEKATELGMKTCQNTGSPDCRVLYSACSWPVRIR